MLALGSVKTIITENVKNGRIQFDMHGFLAGVVLGDLNLTGESGQQKNGNKAPEFFCKSVELLTRTNFESFVISLTSNDLTSREIPP